MKIFSAKRLRAVLIIGLVVCMCTSVVKFEASCMDIRDNVLRLHILANSDSQSDQQLKLKVRDVVINESETDFDRCTDLEDALNKAEASIDSIKDTAQRVIAENGYDYSVEVAVGTEFFNTRVYDELTLPAGFYKSLIIKIGDAKGKNWWCVMYPSICVGTATKNDFESAVGDDGAEIAENPIKYQVKFKIVEYYQNFKKNILKK